MGTKGSDDRQVSADAVSCNEASFFCARRLAGIILHMSHGQHPMWDVNRAASVL